MQQNKTHAVMAQRHEAADSLDDFPTPPWATRALFEHVLKPMEFQIDGMAWEPACGRGDMADVLDENFSEVFASDIHDYGYGETLDFLTALDSTNWIITNPPFNKAADFIEKAVAVADDVAILARTVFVEGTKRYAKIFKDRPPSIIAQFTERVCMVKGRLDPEGTTATAYAWFIWNGLAHETRFMWIPPCRKALTKPGDYDRYKKKRRVI